MMRTLRRAGTRHRMAGQATTEFLVAAVVIVPMLLLVPLVGKYIDLMHTAEIASRYVAFEGTVHLPGTPQWKSDDTLAADVRRRFFAESSAQLRTGETASNTPEQRHAAWTGPWGQPMLPNYEANITASASRAGFNSHALTRPIWHHDMKLPDDNLVIGSVTVRPVNLDGLGRPFDTLDLSIMRRTVVLADAWAGQDQDAARQVVERMKVAYPLTNAQQLLEASNRFTTLLGDDALPFGLRLPSYDLLPCDRLVGGC